MARSIFFYTDSELFGGAEEALLVLLETLDRGSWEPTVLMHESPLVQAIRDRSDVAIELIPPMPLGLEGARRVPELVRLMRRRRPEVFHAQLTGPQRAKYPLAAAVIARVPAVLGTVQLVGPWDIDRSNRLQLRLLTARVDRYLAVSRDSKRQLIERFDWPAEKIDVVYNAVRAERFDGQASPELRRELTQGSDRPIVLIAARLSPQKGHATLLQAAADVPEAVFVLAGDGPDRAALEAQTDALGIRECVRFLGHRSDVPELLAACDVFALPSLYEGSTLAGLEAMAAGRAIVSSDIPGTDELLSNEDNALLVPPGDSGALAQALNRLLNDAELRGDLGRRARERVQRDFTAEAMTAKVVAVYKELLGDRR